MPNIANNPAPYGQMNQHFTPNIANNPAPYGQKTRCFTP